MYSCITRLSICDKKKKKKMSVFIDSLLKLPFKELQTLYMRHLLLEQLVPKEVSLYSLSLAFRHSKNHAFAMSCRKPTYTKLDSKAYHLFNQLEDRHVNGLVAYQLVLFGSGFSAEQRDIHKQDAYDSLLRELNGGSITGEELYILSKLCFNTRLATYSKGVTYLEMASLNGYRNAHVELGFRYEVGEDTKRHFPTAVMYYTRGVAAGCLEATIKLATLLEDNPGLECDLSFIDLYKKAALASDAYAIFRCLHHKVSYS